MKASKKLKSHRVNVGDKHNNMDVDRISVLPDLLIHHILSFLPTFYAVRMSVLSKRWRYMWTLVPVLHFDEDDITFQKIVKSERYMFFKFVDNCLRHRKQYTPISDMSITRLKLHTICDFRSTSDSERVDSWLRFAVESNVKELDVCMKLFGTLYCRLPEFVFSSRSLSILKLEHLRVEVLYPISLPSLKALSLIYVYFKDKVKTLHSLFSACPIIEDLHFGNGTYGFNDLCVEELQISGTLRNVSFDCVDSTAQWLEDLLPRLPLLESLTLRHNHYCPQSNHIFIHSCSLKSLLFVKDAIKLTLRTPNLVHFSFGGYLTSIDWIDAPNMIYANMEFSYCLWNADSTYFDVVRSLSNINRVQKMTLHVCEEEDLIIPENVRKICSCPWPNLKHLKVKLRKALKSDSELRDALLWCAPAVETIEIEAKIGDDYARPLSICWVFK